jgi:hypothetical protein
MRISDKPVDCFFIIPKRLAEKIDMEYGIYKVLKFPIHIPMHKENIEFVKSIDIEKILKSEREIHCTEPICRDCFDRLINSE